jgi:molecular chaperone HtpG
MYRLHFSADAPLAINALVYVPKEIFEVLGMGRMEPGVNLYCQKVLIDQHSGTSCPYGCVSYEGGLFVDLPLKISRQSFQDNRW